MRRASRSRSAATPLPTVSRPWLKPSRRTAERSIDWRENMRVHRIAAIPGDGIGREVIPAGLAVLRALAEREEFRLDVSDFPWGSDYYKSHGRMMPENGLDRLK